MNLKFWKKKHEDEEIGPPFDEPPIMDVPSDVPPPSDAFSISSYKEPSAPPSLLHDTPTASIAHDRGLEKDLQLVNAKLDAIKATLDAIVQRLDKLERNPPKW